MRARRVLPIILLCTIALVAASCSGDDDESDTGSASSGGGKPASVPFEGTNWVLTDQSDLGVPLGGVAVTARFTGKSMSGSSGCNTYRAPIARDDPKVEVTGPIAATQIACGGAADTVEQAYLKALPDVRTYAISGEQLTLQDLDGTTLLVYRAGGVNDIVGDWVATSLYTGNAIQSVELGTEITAQFTKDSIGGNGGCNTYGGDADIGRTAIRITNVFSTQMFCSDGSSPQESNYLRALDLARTYEVKGNRLTLFRQGGTIAATFDRA